MKPLTCYFTKINKNNLYKLVRTFKEDLSEQFRDKLRDQNDLNKINIYIIIIINKISFYFAN